MMIETDYIVQENEGGKTYVKKSVILAAVVLFGILMCASQVAFAECVHANINHSAIVWYDLGTMHAVQQCVA